MEVNKELTTAIAGGVVRKLVAGVAGLLIANGWITGEHFELLITGVIALVGGMIWSAMQKVLANKKLQVALQLPAGTSEESLKDVMKDDAGRRMP